jgi:hypothetical protein
LALPAATQRGGLSLDDAGARRVGAISGFEVQFSARSSNKTVRLATAEKSLCPVLVIALGTGIQGKPVASIQQGMTKEGSTKLMSGVCGCPDATQQLHISTV